MYEFVLKDSCVYNIISSRKCKRVPELLPLMEIFSAPTLGYPKFDGMSTT